MHLLKWLSISFLFTFLLFYIQTKEQTKGIRGVVLTPAWCEHGPSFVINRMHYSYNINYVKHLLNNNFNIKPKTTYKEGRTKSFSADKSKLAQLNIRNDLSKIVWVKLCRCCWNDLWVYRWQVVRKWLGRLKSGFVRLKMRTNRTISWQRTITCILYTWVISVT